MKKIMMIAAIAAALVSCQSKGNQNSNAMDEGVTTVIGNNSSAVVIYEGILPAVDGPGVQYVLSIDNIGPNGESGYTLVTTYLDAEGPGKNRPFTSTGKHQVIQRDTNNNKRAAYKLTPNNSEDPIYFVVVNDTILRLIDDSLQKAIGDLNHDIIQMK